MSAFKLAIGPGAYIDLQNPRQQIIPKEFYIAGIDDERNDLHSVGLITSGKSTTGKPVSNLLVDVKGGTASIKNFIYNSIPANKNLRPVIVKLKDLSINETADATGKIKGQIKVSIQFGLQRGTEDFVLLGNYSGGSNYQRPAGPAQDVEPLLSKAISNSLTNMNTWMNNQADKNILLAKAVVLKFTDQTEQIDEDTVYYNVNRPLTWADFKERPLRGSRHGAEIFASFGYDEDVKFEKGIINLNLNIKVFAPKSACWVRYENATGYALNHEQRHFDIVKLVAEHFKEKIRAEKLTTYNYDGPINVEYLESLRELTRLQKQYDLETAHSLNASEQSQWNARIDKELQTLGVKPVIN